MSLSLLTDLKTHLGSNLTLNSFIIGLVQFGEKGDDMIVIATKVNAPATHELAGVKPMHRNPHVQILVRSKSYELGASMCEQIVPEMEKLQLGFVGASGNCYSRFQELQGYSYLGKDDNHRHMWSWNYSVMQY